MKPERDGWALIRWARECAVKHELTPGQAAVLLVLATYADYRTGECNTKTKNIAKRVRYTERYVHQAFADLTKLGLIERRQLGRSRPALTRLRAPWIDASRDPHQGLNSGTGHATSSPVPEFTPDLSLSSPQTCSSVQGHREQPEEQPEEQPSPSTRNGRVSPRARPREAEGEADSPSLAQEVWAILDRGVASLSEGPGGKPWPRPNLEALRRLLDGVDRERALAIAWETREIVQAQDRAPNVTGLFEQLWRGQPARTQPARLRYGHDRPNLSAYDAVVRR